MSRSPVLGLVAVLALTIGCAEPSAPDGATVTTPPTEETNLSFSVRGVFQGALYDGQAAAIEHEAIPGFMPAMPMDLRVADPSLLDGLEPGDKVRFQLENRGIGLGITAIEKLPDSTVLDLIPDGPIDSVGTGDLFQVE